MKRFDDFVAEDKKKHEEEVSRHRKAMEKLKGRTKPIKEEEETDSSEATIRHHKKKAAAIIRKLKKGNYTPKHKALWMSEFHDHMSHVTRGMGLLNRSKYHEMESNKQRLRHNSLP